MSNILPRNESTCMYVCMHVITVLPVLWRPDPVGSRTPFRLKRKVLHSNEIPAKVRALPSRRTCRHNPNRAFPQPSSDPIEPRAATQFEPAFCLIREVPVCHVCPFPAAWVTFQQTLNVMLRFPNPAGLAAAFLEYSLFLVSGLLSEAASVIFECPDTVATTFLHYGSCQPRRYTHNRVEPPLLL